MNAKKLGISLIVLLVAGSIFQSGRHKKFRMDTAKANLDSENSSTNLRPRDIAAVSKNAAANLASNKSASSALSLVGESEKVDWSSKVSSIFNASYSSDSEVMQIMTDSINALMIDQHLSYEKKTAFRKRLEAFEAQILKEKFPPKKIIGYKKQLLKPDDPNSGYLVSTETE